MTTPSTNPALVIAHRGVSGHAVENSWHALGLAVDMGCDGIELDVHVTSDGALVVHHDAHLPGGVAIASTTRATALCCGLADDSAPPMLDEVLLRFGGRITVFVEAKALPPSADDGLVALIAASPRPDHVHLHAFDHRIVARLRGRLPSESLGVLSASYPLDPIRPVLDAGATTLWQEHHLIDAELVDRAGEAGVRVMAWTVNRRAEAVRLQALGVSGLCGNWPERLWAQAE